MPKLTSQQELQDLLNQGIEFQRIGNDVSAKQRFLSALKLDTNNAVAQYSLCSLESKAGNHLDALSHIEKALKTAPHFAPAHLAHSIVLYHLGEYDASLLAVSKALQMSPDLEGAQKHLEALNQMIEISRSSTRSVDPKILELQAKAIEQQKEGDHSSAIALLKEANEISPEDFITLYSLGVSHSAIGNTQVALHFFEFACNASPNLAIAHHAKGKVLHDLGLVEQALNSYDLALELEPNFMEAYTNKAALLQLVNRHKDALLTLIQATEHNPQHVPSLEGQGLLLGQFKDFNLAINAFTAAKRFEPEYPYLEGNLMGAKLRNCDWTDFEESKQRIIDGINAGKKICNPMTAMCITDDAAIIRKAAEIYASDKIPQGFTPLWKGEKYSHRKTRVGFISGDFRVHPVGYLLIGLLENFDKSKFELTGFFTGINDNSELWRRYRCVFDNSIDCQSMISIEVAKIMRAMELDMIVDLSGYTEGSRLDVLAHRPAPIQMTYLGYPGTLGLPFIDYIIADPITIPENLIQHYSEKVLYLPHCYLPRDCSIIPSERTPERSEFNLPENKIVFCSFNHDYKINPPLFKIWMELLLMVPDSVLWLMKLNEGAHQNLSKNAQYLGVDPSRIIFAERVTRVEDHLARYRLADMFLDTFPYNGHTTAGDALLAGLPVVTLRGEAFASRVASSLLYDNDMYNLSCSNPSEYMEKSFQIASYSDIAFQIVSNLRLQVANNVWPPSHGSQAYQFEKLLERLIH